MLTHWWGDELLVEQTKCAAMRLFVVDVSEGAHCKSLDSRALCGLKLKKRCLCYEIPHAGPEGILVIRLRETRPEIGARYSPE